jgi:hypothetical protein
MCRRTISINFHRRRPAQGARRKHALIPSTCSPVKGQSSRSRAPQQHMPHMKAHAYTNPKANKCPCPASCAGHKHAPMPLQPRMRQLKGLAFLHALRFLKHMMTRKKLVEKVHQQHKNLVCVGGTWHATCLGTPAHQPSTCMQYVASTRGQEKYTESTEALRALLAASTPSADTKTC